MFLVYLLLKILNTSAIAAARTIIMTPLTWYRFALNLEIKGSGVGVGMGLGVDVGSGVVVGTGVGCRLSPNSIWMIEPPEMTTPQSSRVVES